MTHLRPQLVRCHPGHIDINFVHVHPRLPLAAANSSFYPNRKFA